MYTINFLVLLYMQGTYGMRKVISGTLVEEAKYPFVVCIKHWNLFTGMQFECACGGTLIKADIVATAAHCFFYTDRSKYWASSLRAYAGSVDRNHDDEYRVGYALTAHPKYNIAKPYGYDCGVMQLNSELKLYLGSIGYEIEVFELDFTSLRKITNYMIANGSECSAMGWGAKENINGVSQNFPLILNEYKANILSYKQCEYVAHKRSNKKVYTLEKYGMLCFMDMTKSKKSTCNGDSGSPLICDCVVIGILSAGLSPKCGQDSKPMVYTRVDSMEKFLKPFLNLRHAQSKASTLAPQYILYYLKKVCSIILLFWASSK